MGSCMSGLSNNKDGEPEKAGRRRHRPSQWLKKHLEKHKERRVLRRAEHVFRKTSPEFQETILIDHLRKKEYSTQDKQGHTYLDYTGGGLYAESQVREHRDLLRHNVFGNPHSINPTSSAITKLDEQARAFVLQFFRASPDEYTVIFTANATHALKLVGEAYPFTPESELLLLWDNHNSVHGIREFARGKGATTTYIPVISPDMRGDEERLAAALEKKEPLASSDTPRRLFAYPAQSNFTGVQHPLEWIEKAQAQGCDVLLDAAAFVPTSPLDLSRWHPDFVPISFYKMFGYPSGAGCLLARKDALTRLNRPWFAGGTVWGSSVQADGHVLLPENEGFEDGTINYLNLPAVHIGLSHLTGIGMETIHKRVVVLTDWLIQTLLSLRHTNGKRLIRIYGPQSTKQRGGTVTFNFIDPTGKVVDERIVDQRAIAVKLSLRTGCFCNPGAGEAAFRLSGETLISAFNETDEPVQYGYSEKKKDWDAFLVDMGMPTGGGVRVSLGLVSNFADVYRFVQFACTFLDDTPSEHGLKPRLHC